MFQKSEEAADDVCYLNDFRSELEILTDRGNFLNLLPKSEPVSTSFFHPALIFANLLYVFFFLNKLLILNFSGA